MSKVKSPTDLGSVDTLEQLRRWVSVYLSELSQIINGSLELGVNIRGAFVPVSFVTANVELRVSHGLGRVPGGYFVTNLSANAVIYNSVTPADATYLYLKASAVSNVTLYIF